jgi:acetyl esterase/lipase
MVLRFIAGRCPAISSAAIAAVMALLASPPIRGADEPKATPGAIQEIVYTKSGASELKLDLMSPATGDGPFPAVLLIHGGAWHAGNKSDVRPIMPDFVRHGYVAISPQYRFCPKDTFPAQVHDVKAAVRWIKANAKKYRIDSDRIGAIGFSAGGHLALMLGVTAAGDGLEGETERETKNASGAPVGDSRVNAVVNFFGPTDLADDDIPEISKPLVKDFLGGTPEAKPDAAKKASPLTYVSKDDAPVLTFQGTNDPLVPYTQAIKLARAMTAAGVPGRVELMIGASHGWGGAEMERTKSEAFSFLERYLKGANTKQAAKP